MNTIHWSEVANIRDDWRQEQENGVLLANVPQNERLVARHKQIGKLFDLIDEQCAEIEHMREVCRKTQSEKQEVTKMMFADPRIEWRINDVERKAEAAERRVHEITSLRSTVDSLEYSNRQLRSDIDGLRFVIETCLQRIELLEQQKEQ